MDAGGDVGIGGAMVSLMDRDGRTLAHVLTRSGSGLFLLRALVPGQYRVRADRIGYTSTFSGFFHLAHQDTLTIELGARIEPVSLQGIEASADRRCRVRPEEGLAIARVWEEARKALAAAAWTQERGLHHYDMLNIRRQLDDTGRRVEREDREYIRMAAQAPYASRPADSLLAEGFARLSAEGSEFWGPDAAVLLSDAFLDTHCFRMKRHEDNPGKLVGLEFEPVPGRHVPEIVGTLWLHAASAQLQRLDFRYVNLDLHPRIMRGAPGGMVEFTTLQNGMWIVPSWNLRMVRPGEAPDAMTGRPTASLAAIIMEHGEVLRVHDRQDIVFEGDLGGRIAGTVFDTLGVGLPLARVFLNGEGTAVTTDADGRFELAHLGPYKYSVHYTHPYLEQLWYQPTPVEIELGPDLTHPLHVDFEAPSLKEVLAEVCAGVSRPGPTPMVRGEQASYRGILTIDVTDGEGRPVAGATVLTMTPGLRPEGLDGAHVRNRGQTSPSGLYRICWLPVEVPLEVVVLNSGEDFDRGAFEDAIALTDFFPGRVSEVTIRREAPHRTLLLRTAGR